MPDKWADYLISAVRYNQADTHIVAVLVHPDNGDTFGDGSPETRKYVLEQIKAGSSFVTIFATNDSKFKLGARVEIVTIDSTEYIKTVPDETRKDNLGSLPPF